VLFDETQAHMQALFLDCVPIVAVMAVGRGDPHAGAASGRQGTTSRRWSRSPRTARDGAAARRSSRREHLAQEIAFALGGLAAMTTAGDLRSASRWTRRRKAGCWPIRKMPRQVMAESGGRKIGAVLEGEAAWLSESGLPLSPDGEVVLTVSSMVGLPPANGLLYHPKRRSPRHRLRTRRDPRGGSGAGARTLALAGLAPASVGVVASLDVKADEAAVHHVAKHFGVPAVLRCGDAGSGNATPEANPSDIVFAEVGCHGVAEGAALAAAGPVAN
jgi:cobalt-precorrin 5A hydrolase/precorrin-3B C17-methyltransferase